MNNDDIKALIKAEISALKLGKPEFRCQPCGKRYVKKNAYLKHMELYHNVKRPESNPELEKKITSATAVAKEQKEVKPEPKKEEPKKEEPKKEEPEFLVPKIPKEKLLSDNDTLNGFVTKSIIVNAGSGFSFF